ncbi:MAG: DUF6249 domain-containing protein [Bacteroidota bacterium]|nr:DUF6249 domain-containing protein [Bacteroidota bacterium]
MFTIQYQAVEFMESLGVLIPIFAVLLPAFVVLIVFVYKSKDNRVKYDALIEVSKNVKDSEERGELLNSFQEYKSSTDLRRTGLVTIFTGIGLSALDYFGLGTDILFGVGLLVMFIGVGQMIAGYVYPNQPDEITNTVESYEKK